ncbi:MAG: protease inhibitor I42 family protein [Chloroflexota bacterium]
MKKALIVSLLAVLLLPVLALGCRSAEPLTPPVPPLHGGQQAVLIEISTDEFMSNNHMVKDVELVPPGSLIISLGSNPTTGFQWAGPAVISNPSVIEQESHNFVEPQASGSAPLAGAPGKDVWVFNSLEPGTTTISMGYSRPWEGGEKDAWTLTLKVTVK